MKAEWVLKVPTGEKNLGEKIYMSTESLQQSREGWKKMGLFYRPLQVREEK